MFAFECRAHVVKVCGKTGYCVYSVKFCMNIVQGYTSSELGFNTAVVAECDVVYVSGEE